ncbi:uncharacterized protein PG998_008922 [Apiospora kogelbergensis]|uniref:uncharacterized protein n=1 Tax=Apiospora kogelbergensis TaxID=1337665 RepID=UPI00312E3C9F
MDVSAYCTSHGCLWREPSGITCRNSKKSNQPYCKEHLTCQAAPNGSQCGSRRGNLLNKDVKFCELPECADPRLGATGTRQSVFCAAHTCKDGHCMANVNGPPEVGDTKNQHSYCPVHRPCRSTGCANMVHRVSNAEFRKHCTNHYCEFGNNCDVERAVGVRVCATHRCWRSGCAKGLQNALGRYCEDHECKDLKKPCLEMRVDRSEWCVSHVCRENLGNDRCINPGDQKDQYCVDHVRCEKSGCDKTIYIDQGKRRQLCKEHYIGICEYHPCIKLRVRDKRHCDEHACLVNIDCATPRTQWSSYCMHHKCSNISCPNMRALMSSLSPTALKQYAGLAPGTSLSAAALSAFDPWCPSHRCREPGCGVQAVKEGGFCATHVCREPGCGIRGAQDNGYCDQHSCHERGCPRAPIDAWHSYCDKHEYGDDSDFDDDDDDAWSYGNGGGFNGSLAGPGWAGPFGLGGGGPPPRRRRRIGAARSRSGSRSRLSATAGGQRGGRQGAPAGAGAGVATLQLAAPMLLGIHS